MTDYFTKTLEQRFRLGLESVQLAEANVYVILLPRAFQLSDLVSRSAPLSLLSSLAPPYNKLHSRLGFGLGPLIFGNSQIL